MGSGGKNQDDGYDPVQDEAACRSFFGNRFKKAAEEAADRDAGDTDTSDNIFSKREDAFFGDFLLDCKRSVRYSRTTAFGEMVSTYRERLCTS